MQGCVAQNKQNKNKKLSITENHLINIRIHY